MITEVQKPKTSELKTNRSNTPDYDHDGLWKNCILIGWIVSLGLTSTAALGGNFSLVFEAFSESIQNNLLKNSSSSLKLGLNAGLEQECADQAKKYTILRPNQNNSTNLLTPSDILRCFNVRKYKGKSVEEIPPVGVVLDRFQSESWRDVKVFEEHDITGGDYVTLFEIVEKNLIAISLDNLQDVNNLNISNGILPYKFKFSGKQFVVSDVPLPIEAKNWVMSERNRRAELRLVDTFFIVIILGALGSIIFLTREHMFSEKTNHVRLYLYRPVFGMLLAVGSFILSISLNSLFSEGRVEDIKVNSVLTLAFAAGLLSESTYNYLSKASKKHLQDAIDSSNGNSSASGNSDASCNSDTFSSKTTDTDGK